MSKCTIKGLGSKDIKKTAVIKDADFSTVFENYTDEQGNEFVKIPTWYRRIDKVVLGQITAYTISTEPEEGFIPYSVFVKPNGEVMPYVCIGKWMAKNCGMRSVREAFGYVTPEAAREGARQHGKGYQLFDWQFLMLLRDILMADAGTVNTNDGSETISVVAGIHHLDSGCFVDGVAKTKHDKWVICYDPALYVDKPCNKVNDVGYEVLGYDAPVSGWVKKLGYDEKHPFALFTTETENKGYYECYHWTRNGNAPVRSYVGSARAYGGAFHCYAYGSWTNAGGVRLCYRPL